MYLIWLLVILLAPSAGCLALVWLSPQPNVMTAMCGTVMGVVVSVCVFIAVK
jgi:hypothetical protein